ncbi:MAG: hypothetical protein EA420_03050 [Candidatus Competibacteraceae bacterium]|nr:MAG: hypothetical protein EA420_03050 [Candidatus Competibacteraceae bacterium]
MRRSPLVLAVLTAALAGCQTPVAVAPAPHAQRDLTAPWTERMYWACPVAPPPAARPGRAVGAGGDR